MNGKYLLLLSNQIRFNPLLYGRESIIKESTLTWNKVSIQKQEGLIFEVQRSELELQDLLFDLDELTMLQDQSVFSVGKVYNRPYEKDPDLMTSIVIETNLDQLFIQREGYTILDLLSDVGGLSGIGIWILDILTKILNYDYMNSYMTSKLFKLKNRQIDS